jgi:hypothetical protein
MNENHPDPPGKHPEKTGVTLFLMVGGFLLLIMILGWIIVASR